MTITSTQVSFGLFALELKQDAIPSASDKQPFVKINDLKTDSATVRPYATYEPNYWLLDGGYKFLPEDTSRVHVGLMSLSMSDVNGNFSIPPVLTVNFQQVHSTDGLTLRFSQYTGDYISLLTVAYYDASDVLIRSDNYEPDNWEFSTEQAAEDFKKIVITFSQTHRPYRYLRLSGIDFGELIYFNGENVIEADSIEEVNPISIEVPFSTVRLLLFSEDEDFSIVNPTGLYTEFKERMPLSVHEYVDGQANFIGRFYLEDWTSVTENQMQLECVDLLGVLDKITCRGGIWLGAGITVEDLVEEILGQIFIPYDLDTNIADVVLRGWLPSATYRETLQQIAFASGAHLSCTRYGSIKIFKTTLAQDGVPSSIIASGDYGVESSVSLTALITGVDVTAHNYVSSTEEVELYNETLEAGEHDITFDEPIHDLGVTGATITESGVNYAILTVATTGTVVLTGQIYNDTKKIFSHRMALESGVKPSVIEIEEATLVSNANGQEICDHVYNYYQQRYLQKARLFAPGSEPGDTVLIDTLGGKQILGVIEKMDSNLSGGFIVDSEIRGVIYEVG
jgi:hypothetical protein